MSNVFTCSYCRSGPSCRDIQIARWLQSKGLSKLKAKITNDGNAKELRPPSKGQDVLFELNPDASKAHWSKGVILDRNDKSYTVKSQTRCKLVRNSQFQTIQKSDR